MAKRDASQALHALKYLHMGVAVLDYEAYVVFETQRPKSDGESPKQASLDLRKNSFSASVALVGHTYQKLIQNSS